MFSQDWQEPLIFDWFGENGLPITEEDIYNSEIGRILRNEFDPPFQQTEYERKTPWWNPRDPFGKNFQHRSTAFIPGKQQIPLYPQLSALTKQQHLSGLKVLTFTYTVQPWDFPAPEQEDFGVFEGAKELYEKELKDYRLWARMCWVNGHCSRTLQPKPLLETVYDAQFQLKKNEIHTLPHNFTMAAQISLGTRLDAFELHRIKDLKTVDINSLPEIAYPDVLEWNTSVLPMLQPYDAPKPCKQHASRFILPYESSVSVLPLTDIHKELAQYAMQNGATCIASENALQCLQETERSWTLPISVVEVICPEGGGVKTVVVMGSEFCVKKESAAMRTFIAYRHLLRHTFSQSNDSSETNDTEKASSSSGPNRSTVEKPGCSSTLEKPGRSSNVEKPGGSSKVEKPGCSSKLEKPGGSNKVEKPGRSNKVEKPGGSNKVEKPGGSNKVEKSGSSNKVEKPGGSNKVEKPGGSNKVEKPGCSSKVEKPGRSNKVEKPGGSNKVEKPGGSNKVEKLGGSNKVEKTGGSNKVEKPGGSNKVEKPGGSNKVEKPGCSSKVEKPGRSSNVEKPGGGSNVEKPGCSRTKTKLELEVSVPVKQVPEEEQQINFAGMYREIDEIQASDLMSLDTSTLSTEDINDIIGVNPISTEDICDITCTCKGTTYEFPPPRSFKKWQVKNATANRSFDLIIHSTHKVREGDKEMLLEPIVEWQPELGACKQSAGRVRALALSLMMRPEADLLNVRVDYNNGNIIVINKLDEKTIFRWYGDDTRSEIADRIHAAIDQLRFLKQGQYILKHDPCHGANAMLYSTLQTGFIATRSALKLSLRPESDNLTNEEEIALAKIWPQLSRAMLPYHKDRGILPLAFSPYENHVRADKRYTDALAATASQPPKWKNKSKKKKKKKNQPANAK